MWDKIGRLFDTRTPYAWLNIIIGALICLFLGWSVSMIALSKASWALMIGVAGMLWIPIVYGEFFLPKKEEGEEKTNKDGK